MDLVSFWFGIIAVLWLGYLILEGFDFGVGALLRVIGRDEGERRQILRTIGPVWDGNEVWLLVAGGATFAAFPEWYATLFSGFYLALLLILVSLIVRGMAIEYRNKRPDEQWRSRWDTAVTVCSITTPFLWGVAFVNIVSGVPLAQNPNDPGVHFTGNLLTLLNPQALLGGLALLAVCCVHGAYFIALRTEGEVRERAHSVATKLWPVATVTGAVTLLWIVLGAHRVSWVAVVGVVLAAGALLAQPPLWKARREGLLFALTCVTIFGLVLTIFASMWPYVMAPDGDGALGLTAEAAASTPYTLKVMTWVALLVTPVVLLYQGWTYWVFRQRIAPTSRGAKVGFRADVQGGGPDGPLPSGPEPDAALGG